MELRHFRYFVAVAEHGSILRAAQSLHIAQSAVSEQLADLEKEIAVPLFDRRSRSIRLTPHGELFLVEARKTLQASLDAVEVAQGSVRGERGHLRIGFFAGGIGVGLPGVIRSFRRKYPAVRLTLEEMPPTTQWQALRSGQIDLGFTRRLEPPFAEELRSETIRHDAVVAVLPRDHRLASAARSTGKVDIRSLAAESFVLSSRETSPALFDKIIELCSEAGFSPRIAAFSTVWSSVVLLVEAGLGISLLPLNLQQSTAADLAFCPLTAPNASIELVMAWHPLRETPALTSFRSLVHSAAARL